MAEDGGGFDAAKKGLGEVRDQSKWIDKQVGAGKLRLDPEAAEDAAKICEEEIDYLEDIANNAQAIQRLDGIGDYPDGQDLADRFQKKATDGDAGALELIKLMEGELKELARSFRGAAKDYRATDEQAADDFERGARQ